MPVGPDREDVPRPMPEHTVNLYLRDARLPDVLIRTEEHSIHPCGPRASGSGSIQTEAKVADSTAVGPGRSVERDLRPPTSDSQGGGKRGE